MIADRNLSPVRRQITIKRDSLFFYCSQLFASIVVAVVLQRCSGSLALDASKGDEWNATATTTEPSSLPDLIDLVSKESENISNSTDTDEPNTAKRTIRYGNQKFSSPIVVDDEKLFTPNDEYANARKQINVQIIEPHNNGQFLKETLFQSQENNSVVTSVSTTTTTEATRLPRVRTSTQKTISSKFLAPIQVGLRLSNDVRKPDENCDDEGERSAGVQSTTSAVSGGRREEIEIHRNTKISKITVEAPQRSAYQGRFTSRRPPCEQPCSTPRPAVAAVTSHVRPVTVAVTSARPLPVVVTPPPRAYHQPVVVTPASRVVHQQVVVTPPPRVIHQPVAVPSPPRVIHQPVVVHTQTPVPVEKFVPYPVEKVVKQLVKVPVPVEVERVVVKEVQVPVDRVVEKHINHAVRVPVDRPYPVEKVVDRVVQVPYEVQRIVDRPYEVQKIVTQQVQVPVDRIVEKFVDRPVTVEKLVPHPVAVPVEKIVEKQVPVIVEKIVDRPVPVQVGVPVHVPYYVHVQVPVHSPVPYAVHVPVPVILKPPPPPKTHLIIKTTKYTKGHSGFFDLKNKLNSNLKSIFFKKPNIIHTHVDSIGLSPPPRYNAAGATAFASIINRARFQVPAVD